MQDNVIDPIAMARELLKLLNAQEMERREAVKRSLEKFRLKHWTDL